MNDNNFIREYRRKLGLTQSEFSSTFCIPLSSVRQWEQGRVRTPDYLVKLLTEREELINENKKLKRELKESSNAIFTVCKSVAARDEDFPDRKVKTLKLRTDGQQSLFEICGIDIDENEIQ